MESRHGPVAVVVSAIGVTGVSLLGWWTGRWVLTAIPIGVLFGFFLQKGDLCGASAFSEVVLARDWRKVGGLGVAIVVSMAGIAAGDLLGWIQLNPKPLMWAAVVLGGLVFGVGMVLAGGCVSGCLYKGATGNLNSLAALLAMPFGIGLVEYGPISAWAKQLKTVQLTTADGGPITLSSLTGMPFWLLAVLIAAATVGIVLWIRRRMSSPEAAGRSIAGKPRSQALLLRSWRPWQAGLAIGLLALPAYLSSAASGRNYPLGVTHGVLHASLLVTDAPVRHVVAPPAAQPSTTPHQQSAPRKKVVWWLVLLVGGVLVGSNLSGRLSGQTRLLPKPPDQILVAMVGGALVGAGAALAGGCVIGNILSGVALMGIGAMLFAVVAVLANWATTVLYLRGLR